MYCMGQFWYRIHTIGQLIRMQVVDKGGLGNALMVMRTHLFD